MFYRCYSEVDKTSCKHEALASTGSHWKCGRFGRNKQSHVQNIWVKQTKHQLKKTNNPIVNNSQSQQKWQIKIIKHPACWCLLWVILVTNWLDPSGCRGRWGKPLLFSSTSQSGLHLLHRCCWGKLSFWVPVMVPTNTCVKQQAPGHSYSSYRIIYHLQIRIGAPSLPRHHGEVVSPAWTTTY